MSRRALLASGGVPPPKPSHAAQPPEQTELPPPPVGAAGLGRILRKPAVESRTGLSKSTIYARIKEGRFPAPVALGDRAVGWLESEIGAWIAERVSARRSAA